MRTGISTAKDANGRLEINGEGGGAKLLELDEPRGRWFECERREGGEVISIKSRGGSFAKASVD